MSRRSRKPTAITQALSAGLFIHSRRPGLIRRVSLAQCLEKNLLQKLARAVAYSLVQPANQRLTTEWIIAYRSVSLPWSEWEQTALVILNQPVCCLEDLLLVDISDWEQQLDNPEYVKALSYELSRYY